MEGAADMDYAHNKKRLKKKKEIGKLQKENLGRTLLQCVDDTLPAIKTFTGNQCLSATVSVLNFLGLFG